MRWRPISSPSWWSGSVIAFAHGAYFGVAAIVATRLVPPEKRGSAVALLLAGITVANILGVPAGTAIGNAFGWRATFWAVGAFDAAGLAWGLAIRPQIRRRCHCPPGPQGRMAGIGPAGGVHVTRADHRCDDRPVLAVHLYRAAADHRYRHWLLLVFGIGSTLGVLLGGRLADWKLMPALAGTLLASAVIYAGLGLFIHNAIATGIGIFSGVASVLPSAPRPRPASCAGPAMRRTSLRR